MACNNFYTQAATIDGLKAVEKSLWMKDLEMSIAAELGMESVKVNKKMGNEANFCLYV